MTYADSKASILLKNGEYIHRSTYHGLTEDEILDPKEINLWEEFNNELDAKIGEHDKPEELSEDGAVTPHLSLYENGSGEVVTPTPDRDDLEDDKYDQYVNSGVLLPISKENKTENVFRRKRDANGHIIGRAHQKTACDTREYIVKFSDGAEAEFSANIFAENTYTQCDVDGTQHLVMKCIVDCKIDSNDVPISNKFFEFKKVIISLLLRNINK